VIPKKKIYIYSFIFIFTAVICDFAFIIFVCTRCLQKR